MATKLQELQNKLTAKQNLLQSIYAQSKKTDGDWDFTKAEEFSHMVDGRDKLEAQSACIDALNEYEREASGLFDEVKTLQDMNAREEKLQKQVEERRKIVDRHVHANESQGNGGGPPAQMKSLGTLMREHWPEPGEQRRGPIMFDREFKNWDLSMMGYEAKEMSRTAGWAPESTRIPRFVDMALSQIVITDLMPVGNTNQALVKYMEETTFTNNAAEKAEGVTSVEATLATTERSVTIQKIAVHLIVTEEQLADVDQVAGYVDARLRTMVQRRLETQIIAGDGNAPNIMGFLAAGVASQAKGADDTIDAIYKAMDKVRSPGEGAPSALIIHPTNWQPVRLAKTSLGYVWGHPSEVGPTRIFGIPVVVTSNITLGTALVGDFTNYCQLWMRQGVEVQVGYIQSTFIEGKQVIRVTLRAAPAPFTGSRHSAPSLVSKQDSVPHSVLDSVRETVHWAFADPRGEEPMGDTNFYSAVGAIYTIAGAPVAGTDEVQTITASPAAGSVTAGTFRLSFQGFVSAPISWSASTSIMETALNNLASIASGGTGLVGVVVTGGALPTTAMTVTFSGSNVAKKELPLLVLHSTSLTGGGTFVIAEGAAGVNRSHRDAPNGAIMIRTDTGAIHVKTSGVWTVQV